MPPEGLGPPLRIDREGDCWTVTLDRPDKANALSAGLVHALHAAVDDAAAAGARVLVLRGSGRNFSAGFDFGDFESQTEADLLLRFTRVELLLQALASSPCLTVALAHGRNFGAGVDLFAACQWRIAVPEATFRMPGLAFGIVLGTRRFAAIVGRESAREILEGLQTFDAARAERMGFVRRIAPQEGWPALVEEARAVARTLAPAHRAALDAALDPGGHDGDLALLVRSAAAPGLKQRIRDYLAAQSRPKS